MKQIMEVEYWAKYSFYSIYYPIPILEYEVQSRKNIGHFEIRIILCIFIRILIYYIPSELQLF